MELTSGLIDEKECNADVLVQQLFTVNDPNSAIAAEVVSLIEHNIDELNELVMSGLNNSSCSDFTVKYTRLSNIAEKLANALTKFRSRVSSAEQQMSHSTAGQQLHKFSDPDQFPSGLGPPSTEVLHGFGSASKSSSESVKFDKSNKRSSKRNRRINKRSSSGTIGSKHRVAIYIGTVEQVNVGPSKSLYLSLCIAEGPDGPFTDPVATAIHQITGDICHVNESLVLSIPESFTSIETIFLYIYVLDPDQDNPMYSALLPLVVGAVHARSIPLEFHKESNAFANVGSPDSSKQAYLHIKLDSNIYIQSGTDEAVDFIASNQPSVPFSIHTHEISAGQQSNLNNQHIEDAYDPCTDPFQTPDIIPSTQRNRQPQSLSSPQPPPQPPPQAPPQPSRQYNSQHHSTNIPLSIPRNPPIPHNESVSGRADGSRKVVVAEMDSLYQNQRGTSAQGIPVAHPTDTMVINLPDSVDSFKKLNYQLGSENYYLTNRLATLKSQNLEMQKIIANLRLQLRAQNNSVAQFAEMENLQRAEKEEYQKCKVTCQKYESQLNDARSRIRKYQTDLMEAQTRLSYQESNLQELRLTLLREKRRSVDLHEQLKYRDDTINKMKEATNQLLDLNEGKAAMLRAQAHLEAKVDNGLVNASAPRTNAWSSALNGGKIVDVNQLWSKIPMGEAPSKPTAVNSIKLWPLVQFFKYWPAVDPFGAAPQKLLYQKALKIGGGVIYDSRYLEVHVFTVAKFIYALHVRNHQGSQAKVTLDESVRVGYSFEVKFCSVQRGRPISSLMPVPGCAAAMQQLFSGTWSQSCSVYLLKLEPKNSPQILKNFPTVEIDSQCSDGGHKVLNCEIPINPISWAYGVTVLSFITLDSQKLRPNEFLDELRRCPRLYNGILMNTMSNVQSGSFVSVRQLLMEPTMEHALTLWHAGHSNREDGGSDILWSITALSTYVDPENMSLETLFNCDPCPLIVTEIYGTCNKTDTAENVHICIRSSSKSLSETWMQIFALLLSR